MRVDRMEREMEYLENKIPNQSDIEMEEALLEQQMKDAELDQLKKKAKIKVDNGKKCASTVNHVCVCMMRMVTELINFTKVKGQVSLAFVHSTVLQFIRNQFIH